jgi:hypothetical protein
MPHFECGAIDHSATSPDATLASVFRAYCGIVESGFFRPKSHLRVSTGPAAGKMMGPPRGGHGSYAFSACLLPSIGYITEITDLFKLFCVAQGGVLLPFQPRWRFPKRRIATMLAKTTIALAAALMVGGASAALANDIDESASAAQVARESRANQLPWWWNGQKQIGNAGSAYGFVPRNQNAASSGR